MPDCRQLYSEALHRSKTADRLSRLEMSASSLILDRLNHSHDQPRAYPIALAANSIVEQVIDVAIERCLLYV